MVDSPDGPVHSRAVPASPGPEPTHVPDAAEAIAPGHLLRALEWRTGLEYVAARRGLKRVADWPRGDGHTVLVIPGFLAGPLSTDLLRDVLRRLGYRVYDWGLGYNVGYRASMKEALPERLRHIRERTDGRRVSIIGWSAGGIYALELARAFPDDVRSVITLGSPFRGNHRASTAWRVWRLLNRGTDATEAIAEAARIRREQPLATPTTCIYSKTDGIVAWECCTSLPAPRTETLKSTAVISDTATTWKPCLSSPTVSPCRKTAGDLSSAEPSPASKREALRRHDRLLANYRRFGGVSGGVSR